LAQIREWYPAVPDWTEKIQTVIYGGKRCQDNLAAEWRGFEDKWGVKPPRFPERQYQVPTRAAGMTYADLRLAMERSWALRQGYYERATDLDWPQMVDVEQPAPPPPPPADPVIPATAQCRYPYVPQTPGTGGVAGASSRGVAPASGTEGAAGTSSGSRGAKRPRAEHPRERDRHPEQARACEINNEYWVKVYHRGLIRGIAEPSVELARALSQCFEAYEELVLKLESLPCAHRLSKHRMQAWQRWG